MKYLPLEFFAGVSLIIVVSVIAGRHLRRPGSPHGPTWRYILLGLMLFITAGTLNALPPHNVVLATLVMILGVAFFAIGIATLGGGNFSFYGAAACGMAAVPFLMLPTPIGLHIVGKTITCRVRGWDGFSVTDFTADCPDGHSYDFHKHGLHDFRAGTYRSSSTRTAYSNRSTSVRRTSLRKRSSAVSRSSARPGSSAPRRTTANACTGRSSTS